jgi:hypothetical protein
LEKSIYSSVLVASPLVMWLGVDRAQFVRPAKKARAKDEHEGRWFNFGSTIHHLRANGGKDAATRKVPSPRRHPRGAAAVQ